MKDNKDDIMFRVMNDFVIHPRKLNRDVLDGNITREEYQVYVWLRGSANPYATAVVTISGIKQDVFGAKYSDNHINKILLSLKSKKYLYYIPRQGRRGSFEIKMVDFLLPTKKITTYEGLVSASSSRSGDRARGEVQEEVIPEVVSFEQKSDKVKSIRKQVVSSISVDSLFRSDNNDTNNNNYKNNNRSKTKPIVTELFDPKTKEEIFCKDTAYQLGEQDMRYILSIKDRYGISVLRDAYERTYAYQLNNKVENLPALFNSIVDGIIKSQTAEKSEN